MSYVVLAAISYCIGMIPTALILVYLCTGKDVRKGGSMNMGAMNTMRIVKKEKNIRIALVAFLAVWLIDMGKAILSIILAQRMFGEFSIPAITLAAFFVILGHNYPVYLRFKGGRGAASLMGILLYFNPSLFLLWILIVFCSMVLFEFFISSSGRHVSKKKFLIHAVSEQIAGRLIGEIIALIPFYLYGGIAFYPALVGTVLVIVRHNSRLQNQLITRKTA